MKKALLLITAFIICEVAFAQQDTSKPMAAAADTTRNATAAKPKKFKLKKETRQANRKLKAGAVYDATDMYEDILKNKPDQYKLAYQMAQAYYVCRDYEKAEKWYKYVLDKDKAHYPEARYWYAVMLKMNSKYIDAKEQFNTFIKEYGGANAALKKWAKTDADGCELAQRLIAKPEKINLTHLDSHVNSAYSDISPVMWDDSTLLYASLHSDTIIVVDTSKGPNADDHLIKFYMAKKHGKDYDQSTKFDKFDVPGSDLANGAFSPDHKRFYFTICQSITYEQTHCDIYVSEYVDDAWQPAEALGSEVNDIRYTSTQPAVGTYKDNSEVLYFVSDRPGGKGGLDIWYSVINSKGKYSDAKNAGNINTDRNEATPYYDNSTGTLYFSSQGWPGLGGYDAFKTTGKLNKWTGPENMGVPINSSADDMYFRYNKNQNSGFVVSNRVGIISLKSKTCCDDIFAFDHYNTQNLAVRGYVYDEALPDYPLNGAKVTLSLRDNSLNEDIMVNEATTADDKRYFFDINPNASYKVTGSKDTYLSSSVNFSTKGRTTSDTIDVKIYLKRLIKNKAYSLRNIYYDYNKSDIKEESKPTLDSLYTIMTENPNIIVELGSHTDSRGSDTYNNVLSQKRAESCVAYLIAKGIPKERITAVGYGKTELLEDCSKYPECPKEGEGDCPCHQKNRRTEFKIVGETAPVNYDDDTFGKKKASKQE